MKRSMFPMRPVAVAAMAILLAHIWSGPSLAQTGKSATPTTASDADKERRNAEAEAERRRAAAAEAMRAADERRQQENQAEHRRAQAAARIKATDERRAAEAAAEKRRAEASAAFRAADERRKAREAAEGSRAKTASQARPADGAKQDAKGSTTLGLQGAKCRDAATNANSRGEITFEWASFDLAPESAAALDSLARALKGCPQVTLEIGGHTDAEGVPERNVRLSKARAEAVRIYLIGRGIDANRLRSVGYSSTRPIATNETEEGRAKNRRIEFTID